MFLLLLVACAPVSTEHVGQPGFLSWLIVHVDPLPRSGDLDCVSPELSSCGDLDAAVWRARTENLAWLADSWVEGSRTMDLELGPEASLGWAEEPEVAAELDAGFEARGEPDPAATRAEVAASGRASVEALVAAGSASLGVHVHDVLPDEDGAWGSVSLNHGDDPEDDTPEACTAWAGDPVVEARDDLVKDVVGVGVRAATAVADPLGEPLSSFTGHLPKSMAGKIAIVEDPGSFSVDGVSDLPESFLPTDLGSAYSECLTVAIDHQPFETWRADEDQALLAGDGPPVVPAARVVGSMSLHLGVPEDGSLGADARRLLQALVNWRYAGLVADDPRPWVFTFHAHLFDLYPGDPNPLVEEERGLRPNVGQKFRKDLDAMASLVDAFAGRAGWQGVEASDGAVIHWAHPSDLDATGSRFSYGQPDEAPPEGMDRDTYPYLPLVAERLVGTHLVCAGSQDGVEIYGMLRCSEGWAWGGDSRGYHCQGDNGSTWVYLLIPDGPSCLDAPSGAAAAAAVDDEQMGAPSRCGGGLEVPVQGLLLEPAEGPWWSELCGPWG